MWSTAMALSISAAFAASVPTFPPSFSAQEYVRVQQTGEPLQQGNQSSYWSQGAALNATAYRGSQGDTVYLFDEQGDFGNGNVYIIFGGLCQYYCSNSMLQEDLADTLEAPEYLHKAQYTGSSTFDGIKVDNYAWDEDLGPIVMNSLTLAVRPDTVAPVHQTRKLTPFGNFIGWENLTWTTFTPGAPPASAWDIPNKEYCQMGSDAQCEDFSSRTLVAEDGRKVQVPPSPRRALLALEARWASQGGRL